MSAFQYFLRRTFISIIVFFGASIVIFCLARLIPGDPARIALGPFATKEMVEQYRDLLHLNESIFIQYKILCRTTAWLCGILKLLIRYLVKIINPSQKCPKKECPRETTQRRTSKSPK